MEHKSHCAILDAVGLSFLSSPRRLAKSLKPWTINRAFARRGNGLSGVLRDWFLSVRTNFWRQDPLGLALSLQFLAGCSMFCWSQNLHGLILQPFLPLIHSRLSLNLARVSSSSFFHFITFELDPVELTSYSAPPVGHIAPIASIASRSKLEGIVHRPSHVQWSLSHTGPFRRSSSVQVVACTKGCSCMFSAVMTFSTFPRS